MSGNAVDQPGETLRPLDPRWPAAMRVSWAIFDAILTLAAAVFTIIALVQRSNAPVFLPVAIVVAWVLVAMFWWLALAHPRWVYNRTRFDVSETGVELHRGIVWRSIINVPRSRIQHTDVHQGPLARQFGLARLTLYTAGTQYASVPVEGLSYEEALAIRDFLLRGGEEDAV